MKDGVKYITTKENPYFKEGLIIQKIENFIGLSYSPEQFVGIDINIEKFLMYQWIEEVEKPVFTKQNVIDMLFKFDELSIEIENDMSVDLYRFIHIFCKENNIKL